ncbi:hypothetical protein BH23CHL8_BH23CHL8_11300 [soil metagenome]
MQASAIVGARPLPVAFGMALTQGGSDWARLALAALLGMAGVAGLVIDRRWVYRDEGWGTA